jgi:hypothetical protein
MTPREFKAWFEGFTEAFTGCPTKAQWARIKERVGEIDGVAVTERIYLDRYWPSYYPTYPYWSTITTSTPLTSASYVTCSSAQSNQVFNATSAMYVLGQADAVSIS